MKQSGRRTRRLLPLAVAAVLATSGLAAATAVAAPGQPGKGQPTRDGKSRDLTYLSPRYSSGEVTGDKRVDQKDLSRVSAALGVRKGDGKAWRRVAKADLDGNKSITVADVAALSRQMIYDDGDFRVLEATVVDAQAAMEAGSLSAVELTQLYLDRIAAYDDATVDGVEKTKLGSILAVNPKALQIAAQLDAERKKSGPRGMLHGIPVLVKDNFNTIDMPTTVGCKCLEGFTPGKDAEMVERLREAGAIILAKANLTEFASGYTGLSSFKQSSNPYVPGGESGGSSAGTGAAIAANLGLIGLGSDTLGSIQVPGAYQGLADVYQSFGLVSREGIAPLAGDQDRGGPLTRTLEDSVIMLDLYAGTDPEDATTANADAKRKASYASYLDAQGLKGARIGYVSTTGEDGHLGTNPAVARIFDEAKAVMKKQGATLVDVGEVRLVSTASGSTREFGHDIDEYLRTYVPADSPYPSSAAELEALLTAQPGLSSITATVLDRIKRIPDYDAYMKTHAEEIKQNGAIIDNVLSAHDLDAIVYPTVARFGVPGGTGYNNAALASLSHRPSVSVPSGWSKQSDYVEGGVLPANGVGLPTTVSFLGGMNRDAKLIKLGYAFEQATQHRRAPARYPDLVATKAAKKVSGATKFELAMPRKAKAGSTARVRVYGDSVRNAYTYTLRLKFDAKLMRPQVKKVSAGTSGLTKAWVEGSTLVVVHTKLGSSPAASGDFKLADIPVQVRARNAGTPVLKAVTVVGENGKVKRFSAPKVSRR
ncbi:amidase family protein [Nocardioides houyundeii]|uniref:amidase family protein n=1 Tax=Nocardioides houyundeii TaxID=2045452 RepID=UPI000DF14781|nr:amidase family protein [Nocardioides houyundeii]